MSGPAWLLVAWIGGAVLIGAATCYAAGYDPDWWRRHDASEWSGALLVLVVLCWPLLLAAQAVYLPFRACHWLGSWQRFKAKAGAPPAGSGHPTEEPRD